VSHPVSPPQVPETQLLKCSLDAGILTIELDHGRANEMGSNALDDWEAVSEFAEQGGARAIVTYSKRQSRKGTHLFIAGADVTERREWSDAQVKTHVRRQRRVLVRLRAAPIFHVAVVDGVALGWGTEFLLCCDYRISGPNARYALPETGLGILPGAGGTSELWTMVGVSQALRLGMTGERIAPDEAVRIGLVQEHAVDLSSGLTRAIALAKLVSQKSPTAVAAFKAGVLASVGQPAIARAEVEARAYEHCVDTGEAAIGRSAFKRILAGEGADWGPLKRGDG
jgi:enoyl-CoA hydratase/carnithine racemase